MSYIYVLHAAGSDDIKYVGRTNDPKRRLAEHRNPRKAYGYVAMWKRVIGFSNVEMTIVKTVPSSEIVDAEEAAILEYSAKGFALLNACAAKA